VFKYSGADERSESFSKASCRILIASVVGGFRTIAISREFSQRSSRPFSLIPPSPRQPSDCYWSLLMCVGRKNTHKYAYMVIGYLCDTRTTFIVAYTYIYDYGRNNYILILLSAHWIFTVFKNIGKDDFFFL